MVEFAVKLSTVNCQLSTVEITCIARHSPAVTIVQVQPLKYHASSYH
ncbi:hypothetical protein [Microcoleus sp. CAWBG58]|nr:hypothetical protein [Microcoleus sp. CAWBG58]